MTLKNIAPKVRGYRKLPDLKDTHLLKVEVLLLVQKGYGVGMFRPWVHEDLGRGGGSEGRDTSPKAIHSHSRRRDLG